MRGEVGQTSALRKDRLVGRKGKRLSFRRPARGSQMGRRSFPCVREEQVRRPEVEKVGEFRRFRFRRPMGPSFEGDGADGGNCPPRRTKRTVCERER